MVQSILLLQIKIGQRLLINDNAYIRSNTFICMGVLVEKGAMYTVPGICTQMIFTIETEPEYSVNV